MPRISSLYTLSVCSRHSWLYCLGEREDIPIDIAEVEFVRAVEGGVQIDHDLDVAAQLFVEALDV